MSSLRTIAAALIVAVLACGTATATVFVEVEPNDTFATGQSVDPNDGNVTILGSRVTSSSADFYRFSATAGDFISAFADAPGGPTLVDDPVIGLFNPAGVLVITDDDSGAGFNSLISNFLITTTGVWGFAVSGFSDFGFVGGGSFDWTYTAGITRIPEPTSLALLGLGLAGFAFSRRMVRKV